MKGLAVTHKGMEDIASLEVKEILGEDSIISETVILFDFDKVEDLCSYCYQSRAVKKVLYFLCRFSVKKDLEKTIDSIKKVINLEEISKWTKDNDFKLTCKREGKHNFNSQDITFMLGKHIEKNVKSNIDLKHNTLDFFVYIKDDKGYFGIDFSGMDLSKREYNIYINPRAIKANIAYGLLRFLDYNDKTILLDPFCTSGMITIEAALYSNNVSVNYYKKEILAYSYIKGLNINFEKLYNKVDKKIKANKIYGYDEQLKHIIAARKNAKIAGINKEINFSRIELNDLDLKFDKESIDIIATYLPVESKRITERFIQKLYSEFFKQCKIILKKEGRIGVIIEKTELLKKECAANKFKVEKEKRIMQGEKELFILCIKK